MAYTDWLSDFLGSGGGVGALGQRADNPRYASVGVPGVSCEYLPDSAVWCLAAAAGPDIRRMYVTERAAADIPEALYRAAVELRRQVEGAASVEEMLRRRARFVDAYYAQQALAQQNQLAQAGAALGGGPGFYGQEIGSIAMALYGGGVGGGTQTQYPPYPGPADYITPDELDASRRRAMQEIMAARYGGPMLQAQVPPPEPRPETEPEPRREFPQLELGEAEVAAPVLVAPKLDIE